MNLSEKVYLQGRCKFALLVGKSPPVVGVLLLLGIFGMGLGGCHPQAKPGEGDSYHRTAGKSEWQRRKPPAIPYKAPDKAARPFAINWDYIAQCPYWTSLNDFFGDDFKNPERVVQIACLWYIYEDLENAEFPAAEKMHIFRRICESRYPTDSANIRAHVNLYFSDLRVGINPEDNFLDVLGKRAEMANIDVHPAGRWLPFGLGDYAKHCLQFGQHMRGFDGNFNDDPLNDGSDKPNTISARWISIPNQKGITTTIYQQDSITLAYRLLMTFEAPRELGGVALIDMECFVGKSAVLDSTPVMEAARSHMWAYPSGRDFQCTGIRADFYLPVPGEDTLKYTIATNLIDVAKNTLIGSSSDSGVFPVNRHGEGTLHLGFETPNEICSDNSESCPKLYYGAELVDARTGAVLRGETDFSLPDTSEIPNYAAAIFDIEQADARGKIPNLSRHGNIIEGGKLRAVVPIKGAALTRAEKNASEYPGDSGAKAAMKYYATVDVYLIPKRSKESEHPTVIIGPVFPEDKIPDSLLKKHDRNNSEQSLLYLGEYPVTLRNENGYAVLTIKTDISTETNREIPSGWYDAYFNVRVASGDIISTAYINDIKKP